MAINFFGGKMNKAIHISFSTALAIASVTAFSACSSTPYVDPDISVCGNALSASDTYVQAATDYDNKKITANDFMDATLALQAVIKTQSATATRDVETDIAKLSDASGRLGAGVGIGSSDLSAYSADVSAQIKSLTADCKIVTG